jgi:hypothetical protein
MLVFPGHDQVNLYEIESSGSASAGEAAETVQVRTSEVRGCAGETTTDAGALGGVLGVKAEPEALSTDRASWFPGFAVTVWNE